MDAVGPHIDVVGGGQIAFTERLVISLPLGGQPGHRGRGQAGRGAQELLERGHEIARGQAVQVEPWQHLADLRGLPCPGWQDRRRELLALACRLLDALVVDARGLGLDGPGRGGDLPWLVVAVTDHEPPPAFVLLISQLGYIGIHFGFERGGKHLPRAFPDDLVDERRTVGGGAVGVDYAEHGRAFPTGVRSTGLLDDHQSTTREGTPITFNPRSIHRS